MMMKIVNNKITIVFQFTLIDVIGRLPAVAKLLIKHMAPERKSSGADNTRPCTTIKKTLAKILKQLHFVKR